MRRNKTFIFLAIIFFASFTANATLIYDANAKSTFTLISDGGLTISAMAEMDVPTSATAGTGIASIDTDFKSPAGLFPGTALTQMSDVSGSAGAPGGFSTATVMNGTLIILENTDSFAKTASFEFTYEWDLSLVQGPATDALSEAGLASAFFHLSGFAPSGTETLAIDEGLGGGIVGVTDWLFNPFITFDFDEVVTPAALVGMTTVTAYVTVMGDRMDSFSVITDATGDARHINEPAPLTILLMGMGILLWRRISK